jgi:hypothetical protein
MIQTNNPFPQYFDADGDPLDNGKVYFGLPNLDPRTNPVAVFRDYAGLIAQAQPVRTLNGYLVNGSTPIGVFATGNHSIAVYTSADVLLWSAPDSSQYNVAQMSEQFRFDLASTASGKGDSLIAVSREAPGAVGTTVHKWIEGQRLDTLADFNIEPDSATDRTAAINSVTSALGGAGFRGWLHIPYGTKFNVASVYAAIPTGVMLDDESCINWGQPPGYKNKFRVMYSGDTVSDDAQQIIASNHHPAMMLLNMGTAASVSASSRYGTIMHGVGKDAAGDPMLGWLQQFAKDPSANRWRVSWRLQTPYNVAIANPGNWTASQVVTAGAYRISDGGKVYQTTAGGTCGATAPTGTGAGISDGSVLWDYVQSALNVDSTRMDLDENGNLGMYASSGSPQRLTMKSGARSHYFEIDDATNDLVWKDDTRGLDVVRSNTAGGVRLGRIQSMANTTTNITSSGALAVTSAVTFLTTTGGPWDITNITLPVGQTSGRVTLWFANANLVLKNNVSIVTGTGADIISATNMMVTLYKDASISAAWVVWAKN